MCSGTISNTPNNIIWAKAENNRLKIIGSPDVWVAEGDDIVRTSTPSQGFGYHLEHQDGTQIRISGHANERFRERYPDGDIKHFERLVKNVSTKDINSHTTSYIKVGPYIAGMKSNRGKYRVLTFVEYSTNAK